MRRSPFRGSFTRTSPWLIGTILALPIKLFDKATLRYFNIPPELFWGFVLIVGLIIWDRLDEKIGKADAVTVANNGLVQDDAEVDFTDISKIIHKLDYSYKCNRLWCYVCHPSDEFEDERDGVYIDVADVVRRLTRSPLNQWCISRLNVTMSQGMSGKGLNISYRPLGKYSWWENTFFRFCLFFFLELLIMGFWKPLLGLIGLVALLIIVLHIYEQVKVTLTNEGVTLVERVNPIWLCLWSKMDPKEHFVKYSDIAKVEKGIFRTKLTTKNGEIIYFPQACFLLPELITEFSDLGNANVAYDPGRQTERLEKN
ncbi:hypothetical protein SRRS_45070 [Sporomusa rhizae]|uniref:hypothetical protein n=1 Tax=Sporomusa rhizae TaxID=357999 RepID=UPI00352B753E